MIYDVNINFDKNLSRKKKSRNEKILGRVDFEASLVGNEKRHVLYVAHIICVRHLPRHKRQTYYGKFCKSAIFLFYHRRRVFPSILCTFFLLINDERRQQKRRKLALRYIEANMDGIRMKLVSFAIIHSTASQYCFH
jgi:hypothetical protein